MLNTIARWLPGSDGPILRVREVFDGSGFPDHTYVTRDDGDLERLLADSLETAGGQVVLTGPSSAGETCLWRKILSSAGWGHRRFRCTAETTAPEIVTTPPPKGSGFSVRRGRRSLPAPRRLRPSR